MLCRCNKQQEREGSKLDTWSKFLFRLISRANIIDNCVQSMWHLWEACTILWKDDRKPQGRLICGLSCCWYWCILSKWNFKGKYVHELLLDAVLVNISCREKLSFIHVPIGLWDCRENSTTKVWRQSFCQIQQNQN